VTFALALPAAGHKAEGPPTITCDEVSVDLTQFPSGTHITWHITVNGTEHEKVDQFTGPSGTSSVSIADLTTATGTLNIEAFASWDIQGEGSGESETTELTTVCHEAQPPPNGVTTETPPTEVSGVSAERAPAAAAAPVSAAPTFTG
jgi:hypothetical protein